MSDNSNANKKTVLITRTLENKGLLNELKEKFNVIEGSDDKYLTREELKERVKNVHGLIAWHNDKIDSEIIDLSDNLEIIANFGAGYNLIDVDYASKKNIVVTNTPTVLNETVSELAMGLMLAVARKIPQAHIFTKENKMIETYQSGVHPNLFHGTSLFNKTLGIIGMGGIGQKIAAKALAFNMKIIYYNRKPLSDEIESSLGNAKYCSTVDEIVKNSDFLLLACPLTAETHHLIDKQQLLDMKKGSILINIARGPVVNESALVETLRDENSNLQAAALDVYENEPVISEELLSLDNVVFTPHIGSATSACRSTMFTLCVNNVIKVFNQEIPITPVNFDQINNNNNNND
eukprot:TRINITY_DN4250_c0_g1_i1.p1 TRINITY_DN4250_c0_g1~~TRINITY_DN4250_c0_g1_i1.p1  ORF type:complete len:349 (-),score=120.85 TRINITY_DN4250_c0_g1_i1:87-1133(-)